MLKPAYKLTIGAKVVDTTAKPQASTVVKLIVTLDLDTPADSLLLTFGNVGSFKPKRDDRVIVELGYADDGNLTKVFTGTIASVDSTLTTTRVTAYSGASSLLRTFAAQTFENKSAGAIVRDLAGRAKVDVATAADGIQFPAYVIEERRSVQQQMQDLAELSGFDVYFNPDGKLVFQKFTTGQTVHVFEFAKHILDLEVLQSPAAASQVLAFGESPGPGRGDESWAWLTKDFSGLKGTAGSPASGSPALLLERPALRSKEAASAAANAAFATIQHNGTRGRLNSVGRPEVRLGDAIRVSGVPNDSLNKVYQVRGVTHTITKLDGFTTAVDFRGISL